MANGIGEIGYIIINTRKQDVSVAFWSSLLGRTPAKESAPYIDLPSPGKPTLSIQYVESMKETGSNTHIDIVVRDLDMAIKQVTDIGGKLVEMKQEKKWRWAIMADPDDNVFCLVTG